jgi:putative Holliday junction resolvase
MTITSPEQLAHLPNRRFLCLDVGEKTIGMAVSDHGGIIATPIKTIRRSKFTKDAEELAAFVAKEKPVAIVIGLPVNMDGTEGPRCQSTRQFAMNLLKHIDLPITLWDERLTTMAVNRMMIEEADLSRARRAELVDKLAAAYMLQGFLDYIARIA